MKKSIIYVVGVLACCTILLQSCIEDKCQNKMTYTLYEPVFIPVDQIRIDIKAELPKSLKNTGKIYFYNNYVLINELREGIHVIDNADPSNPQNIAFIPIPGNRDIAVKNNILYADNYMDLLSINISNILGPVLEKRTENVFNVHFDPSNGYISHYQRTETTEEIDCYHYGYQIDVFQSEDGVFVDQNASSGELVNVTGTNNGITIAGSMARFGLYQNYLYTLDDYNMDVFDISTNNCPVHKNEVHVGWAIETIFPYENNLFIGASDGMYIFNNSNPENPFEESKFEHARACDPVYVSGNRAFVTLRNGHIECDGFENQLDVVDISQLNNPQLIKTYAMDNPHGLSITSSHKLFICEGAYGIKILNAEDSNNIYQTGEINDLDAYDVIALNENHILVIGKDGFYQFDTSDPQNIKELSSILVEK